MTINECEKVLSSIKNDKLNIRHKSTGYGIVEIAEWLINELKAADVPVKHGRWFHINNEGFIYCSECNHEAYWDTDYGQQLFDYCPYCGAKMIKDGEKE